MKFVTQRIWFGLGVAALLAFGEAAESATITASSASFDAVNAAVTAAVAGDTIRIPAGTADWTGKTLTTTKAISFSGAGPGLTILTNSGANRFMTLSPSTDRHIKISGIAFSQAYNGGEIPSLVIDRRCTALWIDDCLFRNGSRSFYGTATCYGLIRNTTFLNCDVAIAIENAASGDSQDGDAEWAAGYRLGTTNTMVVEDSIFRVNQSPSGSWDEQFYGQGASRYTVRRCVFDGTGAGAAVHFFDAHGNWNIGVRGSHVYEVYENRIVINPQSFSMAHFRGGCMLFWSNIITAPHLEYEIFRFRNEELNTHSTFSPIDQLQNSHWWGNTLNGVPQTEWTALNDNENYNWLSSPDVVLSGNEDSWVPAFMKAKAWALSTSYTQVSGSTPPSYRKHNGRLYRCIVSHTSSASTEPGVGASWRTVWANDAWHVNLRSPQSGDPIYPYRPLIYPHPMVTGQSGDPMKPLAPTGVRVQTALQAFNR